jgi:hypothetical protein
MSSERCFEKTRSSGMSDTCGIELRLNPLPQRGSVQSFSRRGVRIPPLPQRGFISQPRVARHELPWDSVHDGLIPQRGFVRGMGQRSSAPSTQPRWGWMMFGGCPGVGRRSSVQPRALGRIPVGENTAVRATIHIGHTAGHSLSAIRTVTTHRPS